MNTNTKKELLAHLEQLETTYFENDKSWGFYPPDYRGYTKQELKNAIKELSNQIDKGKRYIPLTKEEMKEIWKNY